MWPNLGFAGYAFWYPGSRSIAVVWAGLSKRSMAQTHKNGTPAYQRIRTAILKRIEAGQLKAGDSVDSERELARINKVSLMTARHALATLEKEGMVERRRGPALLSRRPKSTSTN